MIKDFELIPSVVAAAGSKMDDGELLFTFPGVLEAIRAGTDLPPKSVHGRIRQVDSMAPPKSAAGAVKNLGNVPSGRCEEIRFADSCRFFR